MSISVPVRIWEPLMLQVPLPPTPKVFLRIITWPTHQIYQKLATVTTSCSVSLFLVNQVKLNARGKKQLSRKGFVSSFDAWYSVYDNSLFLTALIWRKIWGWSLFKPPRILPSVEVSSIPFLLVWLILEMSSSTATSLSSWLLSFTSILMNPAE